MLCIRFATHGKDSIPALHITRPYICGISAPYSPIHSAFVLFRLCDARGKSKMKQKSSARSILCALCFVSTYPAQLRWCNIVFARHTLPLCCNRARLHGGRWGGAEERESNCNANIIRKLVAALQWINTAFQANFNICLSVACLFVFVWCFSLCLCVCLIFFQLKLS